MDKSLRATFHIFARNDCWGTCVDCPKDSENNYFPEFCVNFGRYDHRLNFESLVARYFNQKYPSLPFENSRQPE